MSVKAAGRWVTDLKSNDGAWNGRCCVIVGGSIMATQQRASHLWRTNSRIKRVITSVPLAQSTLRWLCTSRTRSDSFTPKPSALARLSTHFDF